MMRFWFFSRKFIAGLALAGLIVATPAISSEIEAQSNQEVAAIVPLELAIELGVEWTQLTDVDARVEIPRSTFEEITSGEYQDQVSEDILYQTFSSYDTSQPPVTSGKVNLSEDFPEFDGSSESDPQLPYRVAVLDTGVERDHPYLLGKIAEEVCFTTTLDYATGRGTCPNDKDFQIGSGASATTDSHGTHVSGIIVGNKRTVNSKIYEGVAPGAEVISIKVCDGDCRSGLPSSSILSGLQWVLEHHEEYRIVSINMSFGGGGERRGQQCDSYFPALTRIMADLWAVGVAPVAASGNGGSYSQISSPACVSNVISVGSTTGAGGISDFSDISQSIDLLAQGGDVNSSVLGGQMRPLSGTSMAAPVVAAAIAVLRSVDHDNTVDNYLEVLREQSEPIRDVVVTDLRRLKIDRAATYLLGAEKPSAPTNPTLTQLDKDFAEVTWGPAAGVDGYVVSFGNQVVTVGSSKQSLRIEIDGESASLVAAVASSKGGVVSEYVQTPTLNVTTKTTRPAVQITDFSVPEICARSNSYQLRLRVSHADSRNVTGFIAWNTADPKRVFRGSKMNFVNSWDSNLTVTTSRDSGQVRVAAIYKDGSTGASRLINFGGPYIDVTDGPVATSFSKVSGGWKINWLDPITDSGLVSPKIHIFADNKKVREISLGSGSRQLDIQDKTHSYRKIEICISGLRTYDQYSWRSGSLRSTFDTASVLAPTAVGTVRSTSPSSRRVSTSFTAAGTSVAAPITSYQVKVGSVTSSVSASSRSFVQSVPHPGEYTVHVRARNKNGLGPWVKTTVVAKGSSSVVISAVSVRPGYRQATLSWKIVSSQRSQVEKQEVTIGSRKIAVSRTESSLAVKNLRKGSNTVCVVTHMKSGAKITKCSKVSVR
jgi:hypothetical protein